MPFTGSLADRQLIQELNATYGDAVSRRDEAAFAATWAEDAVWHLPWLDPVEGRDAIVALWLAQMANYPFHNFSFYMGTIEVDGDRATGRKWTTELVVNARGESGRVTGRYDDDYVRRDGDWLYARKVFTPLHGMETII
jgi:uncharacterized protein (TIGR02246 family)